MDNNFQNKEVNDEFNEKVIIIETCTLCLCPNENLICRECDCINCVTCGKCRKYIDKFTELRKENLMRTLTILEKEYDKLVKEKDESTKNSAKFSGNAKVDEKLSNDLREAVSHFIDKLKSKMSSVVIPVPAQQKKEKRANKKAKAEVKLQKNQEVVNENSKKIIPGLTCKHKPTKSNKNINVRIDNNDDNAYNNNCEKCDCNIEEKNCTLCKSLICESCGGCSENIYVSIPVSINNLNTKIKDFQRNIQNFVDIDEMNLNYDTGQNIIQSFSKKDLESQD